MSVERTTRFKLEAALARPVASYLRSRGYNRIAREVPFYDRSIDLYGWREGANRSIAVELKLAKWRRALAQATVYQLCADVAMLALPARQADHVDLEALREYGVGLLAVTDAGKCEERLCARATSVLREDYKTECRALMRGRSRWQR
jgi:hypothetical protein